MLPLCAILIPDKPRIRADALCKNLPLTLCGGYLRRPRKCLLDQNKKICISLCSLEQMQPQFPGDYTESMLMKRQSQLEKYTKSEKSRIARFKT